jgi:predicted porin
MTSVKKSMLHLAIVACFAAAAPAFADELSDLKAEIAAQKKAAAEQAARLDALERKLNATLAGQVQPAAAPQPVPIALKTDQNGNPLNPSANGVSLYNDANTDLHIYGLIEATGSRSTNQAPNGSPATGFQVAWFSGNRLGFDADHAIPGLGAALGFADLKVISKLETEFELPTGDMDTKDVFFNRDAWVGFYAADLGKLTFGRQNTLTRDFTQNWGDAYGTSDVTLKEGGYSNVNNFKQFIFYSGSANGTRVNSGIDWKKLWGDHWVTGLAYSFGSGGAGGSGDVGNGGSIPGDFTKGTTQAASVAYNRLVIGPGFFDLNLSYDRANVADLIHESTLFGGNYVLGAVRINGGLVHYTAQQGQDNKAGTRTDNSWTTSISFQPGMTEYDLGYVVMKGDNAGFNGGGNILNPFGNTSGVTKTANGAKHTEFASIIYHADRQLDLYLVADHFDVTGGWTIGDAQGNGNHFGAGSPFKGETELGAGFRYKF